MKNEMINKLYLELSEIATLKTKKELELETLLKCCIMAWNEDGIDKKHQNLFNRIAFKVGIRQS